MFVFISGNCPRIALNPEGHHAYLGPSMGKWAVENGFRCAGFGSLDGNDLAWKEPRVRCVDFVAPDGTEFRQQGRMDPDEWTEMKMFLMTRPVAGFQAPRYDWYEFQKRGLKTA